MEPLDIVIMIALVLGYGGSFISLTVGIWAIFYFVKPIIEGIFQKWKQKLPKA